MNINIEDIKEIARRAGERILECYDGDYKVAYKTPDKSSPLTVADLEANNIILDGLKGYGFSVLSEESADDKSRLDSEYVWIVDPLDGTRDFVGKTGEFCVMIGLVRNKRPVLGVVYEPAADRLYFAEAGQGAFREKDGRRERIRVSDEKDFGRMKILVSRSHLLEKEVRFAEKLRLEKKVCGSAGLKLCRTASGGAEIYANTSDRTSEWDTCAGNIILTEAGGQIMDMHGGELTYNNPDPKHRNGFLASNGVCHQELTRSLKNI